MYRVTMDRLPRTPCLTKLDHINNSAITIYVAIALSSIAMNLAVRMGASELLVKRMELVRQHTQNRAFIGQPRTPSLTVL